MRETWLQGNRRPYQILAGAGIAMAAAGLLGAGLGWQSLPLRGIGLAFSAAGLLFTGLGCWLALQPRLLRVGDALWFFVRRGAPVRVPLADVECFLLGQGPALLKGREVERANTATLVVHLAERAAEWEHLETDVRLAAWCGHFVTLRGTWTEPLNVELVHRLNARLAAAQQGASAHAPPRQVAP